VIEVSVSRRVSWGIALWRNLGAEIRPMPEGGLCVPSCTEPGFIYRVSLAGEGCCSCPDWQHHKQPCKHVYAASVWAAKQRRALVLAEQQRAA
jgi:SWIM zinc finger